MNIWTVGGQTTSHTIPNNPLWPNEQIPKTLVVLSRDQTQTIFPSREFQSRRGQQQQQQLIIVSALEAPARPGFVVGLLEELLFVLKLPLSPLDCGKQNMNEIKEMLFVVFQ